MKKPLEGFRLQCVEAAVELAGRGWSVVPVKRERHGNKKPPCLNKVEHLHTTAMSPEEARRCFEEHAQHPDFIGVGIFCGSVSGGLYVRDFDTKESYEAWKKKHPELAKTLPTVATARGFHVYARSSGPELRTRCFEDGEAKGAGTYVLVPPSVHPTGVPYEWIVPLGETVPLVDLEAAGLRCQYLTKDDYGELPPDCTVEGSSVSSVDSVGSVPPPPLPSNNTTVTETTANTTTPPPGNATLPPHCIAMTPHEVVRACVVTGRGQHQKMTRNLARGLKLNAGVASSDEAVPYFDEWFALSKDVLREDRDECWFKFVHAWSGMAVPLGSGPGFYLSILEASRRADYPKCASRYKSERTRDLVRFLWALSIAMRGNPFALSTYQVEQFFEIPAAKAWMYLRGMCDGDTPILKVTKNGKQCAPGKRGEANRYKYLGD